MVVIPVITGEPGTIPKGLVKGLEIREQVVTIQTTALIRSTRILRRVLETRDLVSGKLQGKTIRFEKLSKE